MTLPDQITVKKFQPLFLCLKDIGPFQEKTYIVDLTDAKGEGCNIFLLLSKNGNGKTTILRTFFQLMHCLLPPDERELALSTIQGRFKSGQAQLDICVELTCNMVSSIFILSLMMGKEIDGKITPLKAWQESELDQYNTTVRKTLLLDENPRQWINADKRDPLKVLRQAIAVRSGDIGNTVSFMDSLDILPSVLWLSTQRSIDRIADDRPISQPECWGYRLAYDVSGDAGQWNQSLDNLLVWMKWLDDGTLERTTGLVNDYLFKGSNKFLEGVRKTPPEAIVSSDGHKHRLDQLSSGEQSLVQMLLRIGAHMTQNSIILIDELELHLHPNWQHKILNILKRIVRDHPGLTIIASTHSREILGAFPLDIQEKGVRKGGDILHAGFC
ncbi:MAG: AAA family ATPase [Mariprofundaceae bacterium]|nr:AAA family ATPase [Mariprofundaceae bacterium]